MKLLLDVLTSVPEVQKWNMDTVVLHTLAASTPMHLLAAPIANLVSSYRHLSKRKTTGTIERIDKERIAEEGGRLVGHMVSQMPKAVFSVPISLAHSMPKKPTNSSVMEAAYSL